MENIHGNNTEKNRLASLHEFNKDYIDEHSIVTIILGILSLIGTLGNTMVVLVYVIIRQKTTHNVFILTLAVASLLVCCIAIPLEIAEKLYHYTMHTTVSCQISRSISYLFVIMSASVLLPITVDRYRRVCHPFGKHISRTTSAVIIVTVFCTSVIFSWPNIILWNVMYIDLHHNGSGNLTGLICVTYSYYDHTILPVVYTGGMLLLTIIHVFVISILYVFIGRQIFAHIRFRKKFKKYNSESAEKSEKRQFSEPRETSRKITKIAFIIVVVFILSYIPTSIAKIIDTVWLHHQLESDSSNINAPLFSNGSSNCNSLANNKIMMISGKDSLFSIFTRLQCMLANKRSLNINSVLNTITEYNSCCEINRVEMENNYINIYFNGTCSNPFSLQTNSLSSFHMSSQIIATETNVIVSVLKHSGWREIVILHDNTTARTVTQVTDILARTDVFLMVYNIDLYTECQLTGILSSLKVDMLDGALNVTMICTVNSSITVLKSARDFHNKYVEGQLRVQHISKWIIFSDSNFSQDDLNTFHLDNIVYLNLKSAKQNNKWGAMTIIQEDGNFTGLCFDILNEIARRLNFTYSVTIPPDGAFGAELPNGTWTGMVGMIQNERPETNTRPADQRAENQNLE
ncbi:unnamed protein product [Mytilus coruscus]|uniref:G-protein coupled receptors family 1 profile domain-containing protein n=1 Tax=Mytilus coruscus TaxID=42192 RepID=A0A6J8BW32_MYTCO|nr:unnamed protein product [Mytilus coruscus]